MQENKQTWESPELTVYGDVDTLTQQLVKPKTPGSTDDFGVTGISDP
jgi:hypothetical protein